MSFYNQSVSLWQQFLAQQYIKSNFVFESIADTKKSNNFVNDVR